MIKQRLTIDKTDSGYVLCVDGGSIECQTESEVMSRVGAEMGMPFNKAQRQLFERMESAEKVCKALEAENAALAEMRDVAEKDRDRYKDWWYKLDEENRRLKEAICNAFKERYAK